MASIIVDGFRIVSGKNNTKLSEYVVPFFNKNGICYVKADEDKVEKNKNH